MSIFKKIAFFVFSIIFILSFAVMVKAGTGIDSTGKSRLYVENKLVESRYGVEHEKISGYTKTNGANSTQLINYFAMKTDGVSSKLVTWAVQNDETYYKRVGIVQAARDYEKNHPGWIVVGGINADQYWQKFGTNLGSDGSAIYYPSPYYPMIVDGEVRFVCNPFLSASNVVGIKNDGSADGFVGSAGIGDLCLSIIDENGNVIKSFIIDGINASASAGGTTVWSSYCATDQYAKFNKVEVNTNKDLYVVSSSEFSYMSLHESYAAEYGRPSMNTIFARGTIDQKINSFTLDRGQFAIETDNAEVKAALAVGVRIRVEHLFANDELNNCESAIGYHTIHMQNGEEIPTTAAYNTKNYSRALIGKKADGTYVLITADNASSINAVGLNNYEVNAVANYYDVVDLYQMDGGGSVTAMFRQEDGSLKVVNVPSDSNNPNSPRQVYNFLFFVVRDDGINFNSSSTNYYSTSLSLEDVSDSVQVNNIKIKLQQDNREFEFEDGNIYIDGLNEETDYTLVVSYQLIVDGTIINRSYPINFKTKQYQAPAIGNLFKVAAATKSSITISKEESSYKDQLKDVVIHIGDSTFNMGSTSTYECTGLLEDQEYEAYYEYKITDNASGQTYARTSDKFTVKTSSYDLPKLVQFDLTVKGNNLTIDYNYQNKDLDTKEAYILVNGTKYVLDGKLGDLKLKELDFEHVTYEIELFVVSTEKGKDKEIKTTLKKEVLEKTGTDEPAPVDGSETPEPVEPAKTKKKCGKKNASIIIISMLSLSTLLYFLRKKH